MNNNDMFMYDTADCGLQHCTVTHVDSNGDVFWVSDEGHSGYFTRTEVVDLADYITVCGNIRD